MQFTINPQIDLNQAHQEYAKDNRVNLSEFLDIQQAGSLAEYMHKQVNYEQAHFVDGVYGQSSFEKLQKMPVEERQEFMTKIYQQAAGGIGFWYGRQSIVKGAGDLGDNFLQWLNDEKTIESVRQITGITTLQSATAQLTRYMHGDFLTRHNDLVEKEKRRVAFAYYLSPKWHPDWGGLLQFYQEDGNPRDSWAPFFNSISLFDVKHIHAVTSLAIFTPTPRMAISGWFLDA